MNVVSPIQVRQRHCCPHGKVSPSGQLRRVKAFVQISTPTRAFDRLASISGKDARICIEHASNRQVHRTTLPRWSSMNLLQMPPRMTVCGWRFGVLRAGAEVLFSVSEEVT